MQTFFIWENKTLGMVTTPRISVSDVPNANVINL